MARPACMVEVSRAKAEKICPICYVDVNLSTLEEHLLRSYIISFQYCSHPDNMGETSLVQSTSL